MDRGGEKRQRVTEEGTKCMGRGEGVQCESMDAAEGVEHGDGVRCGWTRESCEGNEAAAAVRRMGSIRIEKTRVGSARRRWRRRRSAAIAIATTAQP